MDSVEGSSGIHTSGKEVTIEAGPLVTVLPGVGPRAPRVRPRIEQVFTDALQRRVEENVRGRGDRLQVRSYSIPVVMQTI